MMASSLPEEETYLEEQTCGKDEEEQAKDCKYRSVFNLLDQTGDGLVHRDVLKNVIGTAFGPKFSAEELDKFFDEVKSTEDGMISYEDFIATIDKELDRSGKIMALYKVYTGEEANPLKPEDCRAALAMLGVELTEDEVLHVIEKACQDSIQDNLGPQQSGEDVVEMMEKMKLSNQQDTSGEPEQPIEGVNAVLKQETINSVEDEKEAVACKGEF